MSSLCVTAGDIQLGQQRELFWGVCSNSRIGLEDSPWCVPPCASVPTLCLSSILRRWRGEINQQIQLLAENSEVPAEKGGLNGLFSLPFPPHRPSALHSPHFPFTLLQSPGENSPSCQCNVAHRGNHAASLASGAGENATLALNHHHAPVYGKVFCTLWNRGSLLVGTLRQRLLLSHAGASVLLRLFPSSHWRRRRRKTCARMAILPTRKKSPVGREATC